MRKILQMLIGGLICATYAPISMSQVSDLGTHELDGPVHVLWTARQTVDQYPSEHLGSIVVSPDAAKVFVAHGQTALAYDASTGERIWRRFRFLPEPVSDAVAMNRDGSRLFWTSNTYFESAFIYLQVTHALDSATGDVNWYRLNPTYGSLQGSATSLAVSADNATLFVTAVAGLDYWTVAYGAALGRPIRWTVRRGGNAIVASPDGTAVFVTGESTAALDSTTGADLWSARRGGFSLDASPDGSVIFVASETHTVACDSTTGHTMWIAPFTAGPGPEETASLVVSPDGNMVFVAGETGAEAYSATTGETVWTARFDPGPGYEETASLAVSPDGSTVFVTGTTSGLDTIDDYITVAYDAATGKEVWAARYDGTASGIDRARSIAVSPDGDTVFVTGESEGIENGCELTTIAYFSSRQNRPRPAAQ